MERANILLFEGYLQKSVKQSYFDLRLMSVTHYEPDNSNVQLIYMLVELL